MITIYRRLSICFLIPAVLILACSNLAMAQNCTTSLGDPVLNVTFATGTGYGPALADGITTLGNVAECPRENTYAIVNESSSCNVIDWQNVSKDHTGDTYGRFMLINASQTPTDFYVQRVNGLCAGTTYQFSAWVLNLIKTTGADPNITFTIEKTNGTVLYNSGLMTVPKTSSPTWQQLSFTFFSAGETSVVLRIQGSAIDNTGNDLALDDITLKPTGPPASISIQNVAGNSTTVCQNSSAVMLTANIGSCYTNTVYKWQVYKSVGVNSSWSDTGVPNSSTCSAATDAYGTFQYRLVVAENGNIESPTCRAMSAPVIVNVAQPVKPSLNIINAKTTICAGEKVTFNTFANGVGQGTPVYNWYINGFAAPNDSHLAQYTSKTLNNNDRVTCQLISNTSCATPVTDEVVMHVNGIAPNINITTSTNTDNLCKGTEVRFTANVDQTSGITYQWQVNKVDKSIDKTFTTTDLQDGNIVVCLVTTSTCSTPVSSDEIKVGVIDAVSSVSIVTTNTTVCPNTPVTFNATNIPGATYQWQIDGQPAGTNSYIFAASKVNDGNVVNCLVTNSMCSAPISSNKITMHVTAPITSVKLSALPLNACKGVPVTLTATADQTTGASYQWLVNGKTVTGTESTLVTSSLNNNDVVTCQVSTTDNCSPPVQSDPLTITVVDPPQISLPTSNYEIYKGENVVLAATATGTGLTYKWSPAKGLDHDDIASPSASPTETTKYTLLVTNANGCTQTSAPVTVKIKIKDIIVPNSFTPNNDGVNDKWEIAGLSDDPKAQILVYNRYGSQIFSSIGYKTSWDGVYKGKPLPNGVYYYAIRLSDGNRKMTGYVTIIR